MATITFKGSPIQTAGTLPAVGSAAPAFHLTKTDLSETTLADYAGQRVVLNIFPSIDTGVCAASARRFNEELNALANTTVLCVSLDLPFALKRFCGAEGLEKIVPVSGFRSKDFAAGYGVTMQEGPLAGLYSRAVVVIDGQGQVIHTEQVPEIGQEPDYAAVVAALR